MNNKYINFFLWIIAFQFIGSFLGLIAHQDMYPWYDHLVKSPLTPPAIAFSIVWPILYVLVAIVASLLWQHRHDRMARSAFYLFGLQMVMNWIWSPMFFQFHLVGLSLLLIIAMIISIVATIMLIKDSIKIIPLLLAPYLCWIVFAMYLNTYIWLYN